MGLRANPKVIDPKLLPFFLHSDQFPGSAGIAWGRAVKLFSKVKTKKLVHQVKTFYLLALFINIWRLL